MGFILGALLFLLAKVYLPAFLIYAILAILIVVTAIYIISAIISRDGDEIKGILGAIIFIVILLVLWELV